jgi:hypothetical protein
MKRFKRLAAVLLAATAAACGTEPLVNQPLEWDPTASNMSVALDSHAMGNVSIEFGKFTDARDNPQLIGENVERHDPRQVTTNGDVGGFVATNMRQLFDQAGLHTVEGNGSVILSGEVRKYFVKEASTYKGEFVAQLSLRSRSGAVLWEGSVSGSAEHFGHSYRMDNYYQTLSDALMNATTTLLQDNDFRAALRTAAG